MISAPTDASTGAVALTTALTSGVSLAAASADGMMVGWLLLGCRLGHTCVWACKSGEMGCESGQSRSGHSGAAVVVVPSHTMYAKGACPPKVSATHIGRAFSRPRWGVLGVVLTCAALARPAGRCLFFVNGSSCPGPPPRIQIHHSRLLGPCDPHPSYPPQPHTKGPLCGRGAGFAAESFSRETMCWPRLLTAPDLDL